MNTAISSNISIRAKNFIEQTPIGKEFYFAGNESGTYNNDGTVYFNSCGEVECTFRSMDDFVAHYFFKKDVEHQESYYVGTRLEEGKIEWLDEPYKESEIINDDGDSIFTKPVTVIS